MTRRGHTDGEMGVSSERVGHAGPGQEATDGLRDDSEQGRELDETGSDEKRSTQKDPEQPPSE